MGITTTPLVQQTPLLAHSVATGGGSDSLAVWGFVLTVVGLLIAIWQAFRQRSAKKRVQAALGEERRRTARLRFILLPPQLIAAEKRLYAAADKQPEGRAEAREVLIGIRSLSVEIHGLLGAPGVSEIEAAELVAGELSRLFALIDVAVSDLSELDITVPEAVRRVSTRLGGIVSRVERIATTISVTP